jgi:hypothetical protein
MGAEWAARGAARGVGGGGRGGDRVARGYLCRRVGLRAQLILFRDNGGMCVCAEKQRFVFDVSKHGLGFGVGLTNETQEKGS